MFKLFRKKLNKKGFTLAELLVVVAIIAILVAIAIPIFTAAMRESQLAVNKANVRSVKGAAVAEILAKWNDPTAPMKTGSLTATPAGKGWMASAFVEANGDVSQIHVYLAPDNGPTKNNMGSGAIHKGNTNPVQCDASTKKVTSYNVPSTPSSTAALVNSSGDLSPAYWVVVYIDDVRNITLG